MKISVNINGELRDYRRDVDHWIYRALQASGVSTVVILHIDGEGVNLALAHPPSATDHDRTISLRPLRSREREISSIWEKLHLDSGKLSADKLLAFLHTLKP